MGVNSKWQCNVCGYIYDPANGDPDSGIAPGTPFEALPENWRCPVCGAEKSEFAQL
jgi:rubredoxin